MTLLFKKNPNGLRSPGGRCAALTIRKKTFYAKLYAVVRSQISRGWISRRSRWGGGDDSLGCRPRAKKKSSQNPFERRGELLRAFSATEPLVWHQSHLPLFVCLCARRLMSTIAPFVVGLIASGASYAYISRDLVTSRNAIMSKHLNAGREELYYPRKVGPAAELLNYLNKPTTSRLQ